MMSTATSRISLKARVSPRWIFHVSVWTLWLLLAGRPAGAEELQVPWECSNYEGVAQIRCFNTFMEVQRDRIERLESKLRTQEDAVAQLKKQVDRQAATTAILENQLSERSSSGIISVPFGPPSPYLHTYAFPPSIGFGFSFGRPWPYGYAPYSIRPYGGLRLHRFWGHRHWR